MRLIMGLKLEAGKRYVTRSGWITPPIEEDLEADEKGSMRFFATDFSWGVEGNVFRQGEDPDDLLSEYLDSSRCRAALELLLDHYVLLVKSEDAGHWDPETEGCVIAARAVLANGGAH